MDPTQMALMAMAQGGGAPPGMPPGPPPGMPMMGPPGMMPGMPPGMPPPGMMPPGPQFGPMMPPPGPPPPGMPGMPPGLDRSGNLPLDFAVQASQLLQVAVDALDPSNPIADRLAGIQKDLDAAIGGMQGSPVPMGPHRTPMGSMGPGPEGNKPDLQNLPDVPPPPNVPQRGGTSAGPSFEE